MEEERIAEEARRVEIEKRIEAERLEREKRIEEYRVEQERIRAERET